MQKKTFYAVLILTLIPFSSFSASKHSHRSKYVGQERRETKSLSESDIEELKNGRGWGLAKAAELNGVPGPIHLLEMKEEIKLSPQQIRKIEDVYQRMKGEAIPLGLELIELEGKLNDHFAKKDITEKLLNKLLGEIAQIYKKLRYTHLAAHLETPNIVTPEQIALYNKLRGYSSEDPCENIPKGHDPEMWKKHHNCP
jgi:hypothetical protein